MTSSRYHTHIQISNPPRAPYEASVASTTVDNTMPTSLFDADADEENIECDDISTTREYLNRVSGLLESGHMQLNESKDILDKATLDLTIKKQRCARICCNICCVIVALCIRGWMCVEFIKTIVCCPPC